VAQAEDYSSEHHDGNGITVTGMYAEHAAIPYKTGQMGIQSNTNI
jgi:hypothetical protein